MLNTCTEWVEKEVERWTMESGLNLPSLCVPVLFDKWSFQKDYTTLHGPLGYHEEYNHTNTEDRSQPISINMRLMLKHQQRNDMFFIFTLEKFRVIDFFSPQLDEPDIAPSEGAGFDLITAVWSTSCQIRAVLEVKDSPQPVLGRVGSLKKRRKKTHIMQYWFVLKSVW